MNTTLSILVLVLFMSNNLFHNIFVNKNNQKMDLYLNNYNIKNKLSIYRNDKFGIEMRYPSCWQYLKCGKGTKSKETVSFIKKGNKKGCDGFVIRIELYNLPLEEVIAMDPLFSKVDGKWIKKGSVGENESIEIKDDNWIGLYAIASCAIKDHYGYHRAGGDCLTAFISNSGKTVCFETNGTFQIDEALQIIHSVKFE